MDIGWCREKQSYLRHKTSNSVQPPLRKMEKEKAN